MNAPDLEPETWVALAAAGVALLVGLIGPFVNARTQKRTLKAQREMANDDRLWAKRAELYEEILTWAGAVRTDFRNAVETAVSIKSVEPLQTFVKDETEFPVEIQVGLAAYASQHVNEMAQGFRTTLATLADATLTSLKNPSVPGDESLAFAEHDHLVTGQVMTQAMSDELAGLPRRRYFHMGFFQQARTGALDWWRARRR